MSSELSPYAVHRILCFLENDDQRSRQAKKTSAPPKAAKEHPAKVNKKWGYVYANFFLRNRSPPMASLRSVKLALLLQKRLDDTIMRAVFKHGKPLVLDKDRPRLFVPTIIETFQRLNEEPSFPDVTLSQPTKASNMDLSAEWPQVYTDHFLCGVCSKLNTRVKTQPPKRYPGISVKPKRRLIVETFHVPSKRFGKQLTVELYFTVVDRRRHAPWFAVSLRPAKAPAFEKRELRKVTVRLEHPPCSGSPSGMARTSQSLLLHPDFASEVYGFLDRVHVGGSLTANRGLNGLLFALRHRLPAHHLTCKFEEDSEDGVYWMLLRHFRRDLSYNDVRRFKVPSEAGPAADCARILHHMSNSHVRSFKTINSNPRFDVKMIAALVDRDFSVGALRLRSDGARLTDYRSMDTVFNGEMRLAAFELRFLEHEFGTLVKTTDFFRMATVGRLKTLKLQLEEPWLTEQEPRRWAVVNSPLWIAGIHLLRNAERFEVEYETNRLLQPICVKLVRLCEKFERGEVSELVQHFKFVTSHNVAFPFNDENKTASAIKVGNYEWDVYRFLNASTGDWLTACVAENSPTIRAMPCCTSLGATPIRMPHLPPTISILRCSFMCTVPGVVVVHLTALGICLTFLHGVYL